MPIRRFPLRPSSTGAGAALVDRIVSALAADGLEPTPMEREHLSTASGVADTLAALEAVIDRDGVTVVVDGKVVVHPAVIEQRQQRGLLRALLSKIDMSDSSETAAPSVDRNKSKAGKASARARGFGNGDAEVRHIWKAR